MDKPENYNEETMAALAKRYKKSAKNTNGSRANNLTDNTVIMILSESFSDPTRVPGVELTEDPMPNIRAIKDITTSGLMLSPAIGGGTANIEHQALTGLSLALIKFSKLYTLDSNPAITHQDRVDNSLYVSDEAAYQNVLDVLNNSDHSQFIQLVTMQKSCTIR